MAHEQPDHSLQATALINELVVRILDSDTPLQLNNSDHFLAIATLMMQRILIDRARKNNTQRAGGKHQHQELQPGIQGAHDCQQELLILQEELQRLAEADPISAEVVKKRCQGYSIDEAASQLDIPRSTAYGLWNFGRAWLLNRLKA